MGEGDEVLLVLRGDETAWHFVEAPTGEEDQAAINQQRSDTLAQDAGHTDRVLSSGPREEPVEGTEQPAESPLHDTGKPVLGRAMIFEEDRTKCR